MTSDPKSAVLGLLCSTKDSPWQNRSAPILYLGQRCELKFQDSVENEAYFVAIHAGDLPIGENATEKKVIVAVSIPDGHFNRFEEERVGVLCASQFTLAEFRIVSVDPGYWGNDNVTA